MENQDNCDPPDIPVARTIDANEGINKPQDKQITCWLYILRIRPVEQQEEDANRGFLEDCLPRSKLEDAVREIEPAGSWHVSETHCGLIVGFAWESDANKLLQRADLARIFEGPVQVARFCDSRYRQAILLRDVPFAIPLQDLNSALARQGIAAGNVERLRNFVRVEILDPNHYEDLLRHGLDFFGTARFTAVPERWWRNAGQNNQNPPVEQSQQQQWTIDDVLQCYRCQGFWHVAANCRHLPRCVRCGEQHSVEFCSRPRNNPTCCHCSGPHHAGYRQCPVRLQLLNAIPVSLTLSVNRLNSNVTTGQTLYSYGKSSSNSTTNPGTTTSTTQHQNSQIKSNQ